jgi:hypothetical protein
VSSRELVVAVSSQVALLVTALGLVMRGRWRLSWFFAVYIPVVLGCDLLVTLWPQYFFDSAFMMPQQVVWDVLKLGIALEIGWRTFRPFPGAEAASRRVALLVLSVTAGAALAVRTNGWGSDFYALYLTAMGQIHPRLINGIIWLMAICLALAQWYRVPVHPFHAALLTSLAIYLALFSTLLTLVGLYGPAFRAYVNALDPPAYLLLASWWVYIAWRPEDKTAEAYVEMLRKFQGRAA